MQTLNRYLNAVAVLLPKARRAAVEAELGDTLLLRIEERQTELGRVLSETEIEALLKAHGRPLSIAACYQSHDPFIGPIVLPLYRLALRIGLGATLIAHLVLVGVAIASGGDSFSAIAGTIGSLVMSAVTLFGAMTLMALFFDRHGIANRLEKSEKICSLLEFACAFEKAVAAIFGGKATGSIQSSQQTNGLLIFDAVFIVGLALLLNARPFGEELLPTNLFPLGLAAMFLVVVQTAVHLIAVSRCGLAQSYTLVGAAIVVGRLALLTALLSSQPLFETNNGTLSRDAIQDLNIAIDIGLVAALAITLIECLRTMTRILHTKREVAAHISA
jgi:hypothetical protein